ncbi:TraY domain-containing protein [Jiangella rhizosphaerae]|uniref:Relaxosome protein TraY n=1 Tax=Jiangella rhizosphaerae TaxID=2293569 RepID=A0A418KQB3_9ACTN|nr:TraY domain-containing protein [Jiangella rhizosphaerae]RIQ22277.1 ribbon-helix-helix protein, CopG family [Jiangella rhizosphaerae]
MEISVTLTEEETAALQRLAERSGRSLEDEALDALHEYLARAARTHELEGRVVNGKRRHGAG